MYSVYTQKLGEKARRIDEGLSKLTEIWNTPRMLIGGYADCSTESWSHVEEIRSIIRNIEGDASKKNLECQQDIESVNEFLEETKEAYEELKRKCKDLDTVLAEFNYQYNEESTQGCASAENKDSADSVTSLSNLSIEFTPELSWKYKPKCPKEDSKEHIDASLATPVNEKSVSNAIVKGDPLFYTPIRERPQEPVYSEHFYRILKKT